MEKKINWVRVVLVAIAFLVLSGLPFAISEMTLKVPKKPEIEAPMIQEKVKELEADITIKRYSQGLVYVFFYEIINEDKGVVCYALRCNRGVDIHCVSTKMNEGEE